MEKAPKYYLHMNQDDDERITVKCDASHDALVEMVANTLWHRPELRPVFAEALMLVSIKGIKQEVMKDDLDNPINKN